MANTHHPRISIEEMRYRFNKGKYWQRVTSGELDEHIELMDRVFVFREHEVFREIDRRSLSRHTLGSAFFGDESSLDAVT